MSLNRDQVNPLSALGIRRLNFIPNHFTKISVDSDANIKIIDHWINFNLNSRYAIKNSIGVGADNKIIETIDIGIEDPKEIIMLTLGCPHLHKN